jgi:hypothetical protein
VEGVVEDSGIWKKKNAVVERDDDIDVGTSH